MSDQAYEIVIGLEVHVQLKTKTKIFCRCRNHFGDPPNTNVCPVCLGMPGSLPVMNRHAFELSMKTGLALNCNIPEFTKWDRKNYFYPDLPKGYQISQFDLPMTERGWLDIFDSKGAFEPKRVRIIRAHLEEDAGKSIHDEVAGKADTRIDLNRVGTPLLEIVSEPDMSSAQEAKAYLTELKLLLTYLGVSDCNMQEGSLRVDANVNLHLDHNGERVATPIVEIKNMNSFRAVERALEYEAKRQYEIWLETKNRIGDFPKQTRGWDDQQQLTKGQRSKEESSDYRYFPDPDLVPVTVSREEVQQQVDAMIELPAALRDRLQKEYQINAYDSDVIVNQGRVLVDYFVEVANGCGDGKRAANWVQQDVLRTIKEREIDIDSFPIDASSLCELIKSIQTGAIDNTRAKDVFAAMLDNGKSVELTMKDLGIESLGQDDLTGICEQLLDENPAVVADVKNGKQQAVGSLIGKAKQVNPNVNPGQVRGLLLELIAKR